jgi:hypothetical protein
MEITKNPTLDALKKELGDRTLSFPHNIKVVGPDDATEDIIVTRETADYTVLDRINPSIKIAAVTNPHDLHYDEDTNTVCSLENELNGIEYGKKVTEASHDTLAAAEGPGDEALTPENKRWLLHKMGFKAVSKGRWKNIFFDQELGFDLQHDTLTQLAFRIFKAGYFNAHNEWSSQQKTGKS